MTKKKNVRDKLVSTLADIAANMDDYDGVFILTIRKNENDVVDYASYISDVSYVEALGLGQVFCEFIKADATAKNEDAMNYEEDDDEV